MKDQCTPSKKKECIRNSGGMIEAMCAQCSSGRIPDPSPWFSHIMGLYQLQRGGYPFDRNDLTIEEWKDLGTLRDELEMIGGKW